MLWLYREYDLMVNELRQFLIAKRSRKKRAKWYYGINLLRNE